MNTAREVRRMKMIVAAWAVAGATAALAHTERLPSPGGGTTLDPPGAYSCESVPQGHDCGGEGVCPRPQACRGIGGGCTCEGPIERPPDAPTCGLDFHASSEPTYIPRELLPAYSFNVFNLGPATEPITPGNMLRCISANAFKVPVRHGAGWGGKYQMIEMSSTAITIDLLLKDYDPTWPQMIHFKVVGLSATIPTFASVALGGEQTGTNAIQLCNHDQFDGRSHGWMDVTNGSIALYLTVDLVNGPFPASSPAFISGLLFADLTGSVVTVRREDSDVYIVAKSGHP